ncbi:tRNA uridine(34) 5-carboxymethylaminomethyl modification radical SAM/GNAT enzyme Elp3 [bacterium (Candidatus Gribaldobacteria) CG23_combo_of_CG06-09_8_20_14_all_37_87_8]|uniref:tRNA carboxymethyluridine synthase n=2 Tax=Candidatus Gribaldobacteria TaxID=2798536 RepID=A0A2G9ZFU4_9BACT|nr:MAG: hypothetical protein AUJ25_00935 [Parcubacteria group bacterium CG1_02_37_13]PIP31450.1 MAG: tRNA uridine(34) 5-carboxymethylaminomethyl modification radical SAM/GNAT enzyme Elp3 [bacterium (Candidatus Gribaldobacteria) CG23_combo_of_CG06-09_8_20_14_all_37_87_8]PIR89976.1 MAG: tRNA uridine(34) 5-carboxymethylaminomethyl modification radical SAM/GNAT enzyme Elp3 [bacterium (Candidatus Gribaldobacteria) CG10_big_fil_rev_8_21_14_0_10_37_21]
MKFEIKNNLEKIILELLKGGFQNSFVLNSFKRKMAKKYGITCPKNIALLKAYHKLLQEKRIKQNKGLEQALKTRPVRSLSGIVNVSILTKPWPCKGKCLFCPSQKDLPKSYLKEEPACQRAILTKFSPKKQVITRLLSLELTGHPIDKIELRIIGGTWHYYPLAYRKWFIKECFRACNNFTKAKNSKSKVLNSKQIPNNKIQMLKREQKKNETAKARIIGITIETRPDCIDEKAIQKMRELGITRVELGVQNVFNDILQTNQRGHSVADIAKATLLLKEAGFKVSYQLMPNLPGSSLKKDLESFKSVFQDQRFRPDLIKIYPLALLKNTGVYQLYQKGKFKPYTEKQLLKLLIALKKETPLWVRIERVIRDIPKKYIVEGGAQISNLRELVQEGLKREGTKCKCIRCREVGTNYNPKDKLYLFKEEYLASEGKEFFLSFETKNREKLYALLRLRLPLKNEGAIIREIHTYGQMAEVSSGLPTGAFAQHKGLGKKLMQEAEKIALDADFKKIAVIAGVGVRGYYRKLGYHLKDTYMLKYLSD